MTSPASLPYIGVIDGGAADERPAGFDASEFVSGVHVPAGFAGRVVVSLVRRSCAGLDVWGGLRVCPPLFDNYIGRKRNVDGGVLADLVGLSGLADRRDFGCPTFS